MLENVSGRGERGHLVLYSRYLSFCWLVGWFLGTRLTMLENVSGFGWQYCCVLSVLLVVVACLLPAVLLCADSTVVCWQYCCVLSVLLLAGK